MLNTARVLLYLCHPEYKTILVGREGLKMAVYLPDYTVDEVHSQVGHINLNRTELSCFFLMQLVAATGGEIVPNGRIRSQASLLRELFKFLI